MTRSVIGSIDIIELAPVPERRQSHVAVEDCIHADFGATYDRGLEVQATAHEVVDEDGGVVGYVFTVEEED